MHRILPVTDNSPLISWSIFTEVMWPSWDSNLWRLNLQLDMLHTNCAVEPHSNREGAFFIRKMLISFLFLNKNICCGYSLEAPRWGASNEYPQHMYLSRNKKNIMWIPPFICSYGAQFFFYTLSHIWGGGGGGVVSWFHADHPCVHHSIDL